MGISSRFIYDGPMKGICVPFLNCYACPTAVFGCPLGILQHFILSSMIPFYAIGIIGVFGLLLGRMFCGWVCPFGLLQELMFKLSRVEIKLPENLKYVKYAILIIFVGLLTFITGQPWFCIFCPAGTLEAGIPWLIMDPINPADGQPVVIADFIGTLFYIKIFILVTLSALFVVSKQPFCKMFCPLGAIFSLFNRVSLVNIAYKRSCKKCNACEPRCVMGIAHADRIHSKECIRCLRCTECKNVYLKVLTKDMDAVPGQTLDVTRVI